MIDDRLVLLLAFALGSIPFGFFVAKIWGVDDLRKVGSANIGATNVVRAAGWKAGALTFLLDFLKGYLPMLLARCAGDLCGPNNVWIGVAAVLGHCFSPFLFFKGGKGVSTTFGFLIALEPALGLGCLLIYALSFAIMRVSALGSLFAMVSALVAALVFRSDISEKMATVIVVLTVLFRHKSNWESMIKKTVTGFFILLSASALSHRASAAVVDFRDRNFDESKKYDRIVALMPSIGETLLELGAKDKILAVPQSTNLAGVPGNRIRVLGPYNRLSAETVYGLKPDLVIASMDGNDVGIVKKLYELNVPVMTINTQSIADITRSMKLLAMAAGKADHPKLKELENAFAKTSNPKNRKVFLQIGWKPLVSVGANTYLNEMIEIAGGKNIYANAAMKYPRPNAEEVMALKPEVILICPMQENAIDDQAALVFWNRFNKIPAAANQRVHLITAGLLTKPGFALIEGMAELRKMLW